MDAEFLAMAEAEMREAGLDTEQYGRYVEGVTHEVNGPMTTQYRVCVWSDGMVEGIRRRTLRGQERTVRTGGARIEVKGSSIDVVKMLAQVETPAQLMHVVAAVKQGRMDGMSSAGLCGPDRRGEAVEIPVGAG